MEQGTIEWHQARLGKITASEVYKLMGEKAGINTATAQTYINEIVAEILTGIGSFNFETEAMRWGKKYEVEAKVYYEQAYNLEIKEAGFITWDKCDRAGASPDGLLTDKGIEIKCPFNSANHVTIMRIETMDEFKKAKKEYYWQMMKGMLVTGLPAWDFISYDPRFTGAKRMIKFTLNANDDLKRLEENVIAANELINNLIK